MMCFITRQHRCYHGNRRYYQYVAVEFKTFLMRYLGNSNHYTVVTTVTKVITDTFSIV